MKTNIDQLTEAEWVVLRMVKVIAKVAPMKAACHPDAVKTVAWLLDQMDIQCFFDACDALRGEGVKP